MPDDAAARRPFAAFLQEHRVGSLHAELSDALAELASDVREHGKPGQLTLTIKVAPNADGVTVTVRDDVKVSAPRGDRGAALYFTDDRGNLTRRNPAQIELPLQEVASPAAPKRELDDKEHTA